VSEAEPKAQSREAFRQFVEKTYECDLGELGNKERIHEALTRFYVEEIYNKTHIRIDDEDFHLAYVNAPRECGIDFIHKSDENVLIIQTKYSKKKSPIADTDISYFQNVFQRLKSDMKKNQPLTEALWDVDFEKDRFYMKFLSLGKIEGQALEQTKIPPTYPYPDMDLRVEWEYMGEDEVTDALRNARSIASGVRGEATLTSVGKRRERESLIELMNDVHRSVVMVVAAPQLTGLFDKYRDSLFSLNIRNYLGNTATNKVIIKTLKEEPHNFYYYNNGVSCLADEIKIDDEAGSVKVTNLQIINGAQTVRTLNKASKSKDLMDAVKRAQVLVRITESKKKYGEEGRFWERIVRFNNTQNVVKLSDFRSNDAIQSDLKTKFAEYKKDGREVIYLAKRTDPADLRSRIGIKMEDFAKVIYSFLYDPVKFSGSATFLFDDSKDGGYAKVFGDGEKVYDLVMPETDFKLRSAIWWIANSFEAVLKKDREEESDPKRRAALERKWFVIFVARLVLERSFGGESYKAYLIRHYKGHWTFGEGTFGKFIAEIYRASRQALNYVYVQATKSPEFNHRNWMRNPETIGDLKTFVAEGPGMEVAIPTDALK
jgi:hypothetical protein